MLLWRRNVGISHYSLSAGPIDGGLVYLIISFLLVVVSPLLLVFYADGLYGQSESKLLELTARHSRQAVLVLHQSDGVKVFSPGVPNLAAIQETANCKFVIQQSPADQSLVKTIFDCDVSNVIGYELYSYFDMKMNGFSGPDGKFITQMIFTSSSANRPAYQAWSSSQVQFRQFSKAADSALLPAHGSSVSNGYTPTVFGAKWSPEEAISNHSSRSVRFDETQSKAMWQYGELESFSLTVDFEFLTVVAERKVKMWTGIKYGLIQYLAFFFVFVAVFNKITDFLFESGVFRSVTKMDRIDRAKRG